MQLGDTHVRIVYQKLILESHNISFGRYNSTTRPNV
jgi:hypothetical protein